MIKWYCPPTYTGIGIVKLHNNLISGLNLNHQSVLYQTPKGLELKPQLNWDLGYILVLADPRNKRTKHASSECFFKAFWAWVPPPQITLFHCSHSASKQKNLKKYFSPNIEEFVLLYDFFIFYQPKKNLKGKHLPALCIFFMNSFIRLTKDHQVGKESSAPSRRPTHVKTPCAPHRDSEFLPSHF